MLDRGAGDPLLLQIRLSELGVREAGDTEALDHEVMAEIPGIHFGCGLNGGNDVPFGLRCGG